MRNLVGSFDCINKLKYALRQAFAQQKQLSTRVFSGSEAEPTTRKKKSVMKRNYLTTNYFGGGNSVISGLVSIFHIPTKRWLLIVSKGDNCHHFDVFCPWKPAKHPLGPTRRTLRNGLCRHHQGQKTCFDLSDKDTIAVDLCPLTTVSTDHCMVKLVYTTKYQGLQLPFLFLRRERKK